MIAEALIFVVDDDLAVRDSIRALLESVNFVVRDYESAKAFLGSDISDGDCLIADIRMTEMDGLELQKELSKQNATLPVIFINGHGNVSVAVQAMKAGAIDFIEKPFDGNSLLSGVRRALDIKTATRSQSTAASRAKQKIALLTPRERNVLDQIMAGRSNKIAAYALGISPRTVEIHRSHIMAKTDARSLCELVRLAFSASTPQASIVHSHDQSSAIHK